MSVVYAVESFLPVCIYSDNPNSLFATIIIIGFYWTGFVWYIHANILNKQQHRRIRRAVLCGGFSIARYLFCNPQNVFYCRIMSHVHIARNMSVWTSSSVCVCHFNHTYPSSGIGAGWLLLSYIKNNENGYIYKSKGIEQGVSVDMLW